MDPQSLYALGETTVKLTGPLLLAIVVFIYISVYLRTGRFPSPLQAMFEYARLNIKARRHAGILVYGFIACMVIFLAGVAFMLYAKFQG